MPSPDCAAIRQAIEGRQFVGWRGLPAGCAAGDLFDDFPTDLTDRPTRPLGDEFRPAVFVLLTLPGYYRPMASLRDGALVLVDGMNPELAGGVAPLLDDLGEPAARFDWHYGTLPIAAGEWVYPERGITVFLNTANNKALHIALYQATTLKDYQRTLRPHLRKEPRPMRQSPVP